MDSGGIAGGVAGGNGQEGIAGGGIIGGNNWRYPPELIDGRWHPRKPADDISHERKSYNN